MLATVCAAKLKPPTLRKSEVVSEKKSRGAPTLEDQVVSSGQVATPTEVGGGESRGAPAWEDQVDPAEMALGGSATDACPLRRCPKQRDKSNACQDGCQDGLRPERSPAVGPLSVAVDGLWSVACPERIVVAAVLMEKVRWGIGSQVLHADLAHSCADE